MHCNIASTGARRLAVGLVACLVMTACGSSDDDADDTAPTDASTSVDTTLQTSGPEAAGTQAPTTGVALRFGTVSADSGPVVLSPASDGFEAWAYHVNANGGLGVRQVEVVRCDDQLNATGNQECARDMVGDSSVLAVVGGQSVVTPLVAVPLFNEAGVPYIATQPTGNGELQGETTYAITGGAISQFAALAKYFPENGSPEVAIVIQASESSELAAEQTAMQVEAAGGTVVTRVFPQVGTPDYAPVASQLVSSGADVIFLGMQPSDMATMIRAIRTLDADVQLASLASQWPASTVEAVGDQKEGIYVATDWAPFDDDSADPEISELRASLEALGKADSFGQAAWSGWLGGRAVEAALATIDGEVTREALLTAVRSAPLTVPGVEIALALPDGDAPALDGLANPSSYITKWVGDSLEQVAFLDNAFPED